MRTYNTLFAGTCKLNRDEGIYISRGDYANSYLLYAFDLTADLAEDDHFNLVKHGSVRLALKFSEASSPTQSSTTLSRSTEIAIFCWTLAFDNGYERNLSRGGTC